MMKELRDIGEDPLIAKLIKDFPTTGLHTGPGDDCAVVDPGRGRLRLLKTDAIVAGIHFQHDAPASKVGWKAVARVLSDFAAMGGRPEYLLVTVALPHNTKVTWAKRLYKGILNCLETHGGVLAGGETSSVPDGSVAMISVAGEGSVDRNSVTLRSGGRPGDLIAVTGRLGGSIRGKHLNFTPRLEEGQWLANNGARAMMDLSDGLAKDLPRLAKSSGCEAVINRNSIPRNRGCDIDQALGDGEDYELLVALDPKKNIPSKWPDEFAPLTVVGQLAEEGETLTGGWDHFAT